MIERPIPLVQTPNCVVLLHHPSATMCRGAGDAEAAGFRVVAAEVSPQQLRTALTFPPAFGPTEWGPIPFLPDPDLLVQVQTSSQRDADLKLHWQQLKTVLHDVLAWQRTYLTCHLCP